MGLFDRQKPTKKIDALVTGLILWGTIATIYGIKKRRKNAQNTAPSEIVEAPKKQTLKERIFSTLFPDS